jgi:ABC-type lipoprotein export system ATPase subunit
MSITLQGLLPVYLEKEKTAGSEVWLQELAFKKGEYVKIVAPSGSGKTSLVSFLYGMSREYTGKIQFEGSDLESLSTEDYAQLRRDRFSIVFQDLRLFNDSTVGENIELKRQLNPYHTANEIPEMAERLGIAGKLGSRCGNCSYGEKQRIAIIRALMQPFDFILLDEPFSHLDTVNAKKAMELILEESSKRGAAIILADLEQVGFFPYSHLYHL